MIPITYESYTKNESQKWPEKKCNSSSIIMNDIVYKKCSEPIIV